MKLVNRKRLAKLMVIQEVSVRQLADVAGWKSHTYLARMLRGEVDTLRPEPALRIARYLGVPVDDLFATRVSNGDERNGRPRTRKHVA